MYIIADKYLHDRRFSAAGTKRAHYKSGTYMVYT